MSLVRVNFDKLCVHWKELKFYPKESEWKASKLYSKTGKFRSKMKWTSLKNSWRAYRVRKRLVSLFSISVFISPRLLLLSLLRNFLLPFSDWSMKRLWLVYWGPIRARLADASLGRVPKLCFLTKWLTSSQFPKSHAFDAKVLITISVATKWHASLKRWQVRVPAWEVFGYSFLWPTSSSSRYPARKAHPLWWAHPWKVSVIHSNQKSPCILVPWASHAAYDCLPSNCIALSFLKNAPEENPTKTFWTFML